MHKDLIIYQAKDGALEFKADSKKETIWLTQQQVAQLFDVQKAAISKHVKNIFDTKELSYQATVSKMETVQIEGERKIKRSVEYYNLDLVLSVGYRVNSIKATQFRQWATKTLRQHITKGYTINPKVIKNHYAEFQKAIQNIKQLLPAETNIDHASVLELISAFADTWISLEAYDKDTFATKGTTKKSITITSDMLSQALAELRRVLMKKKEATELFGSERKSGSVQGIVGNIMQTFGGKQLYPTIEEKAANLLYFMVKDHPFSDGNKRSGAYAFVWFLNQAGVLNRSTLTPPALTALTLFIAESDPKHKDKMIGLVLQLLK
ncbi:death-on-curing protein [Candidatus Uhrbacteria bacterium RIFOXYB2_FULL_45_11]|uniref:Death-on-curing protein n=1 Tax=Candidatus Uhrbacteria bacterium RIFOXYB2_FULL_45_11 TaxID=1802421 RepID=A0A1F7W619_9BACT|nr:MAG: death-on-curing protein [Candidatus Uhrbacteria bacterium RIFOXYB2_FULL_45_11]